MLIIVRIHSFRICNIQLDVRNKWRYNECRYHQKQIEQSPGSRLKEVDGGVDQFVTFSDFIIFLKFSHDGVIIFYNAQSVYFVFV